MSFEIESYLESNLKNYKESAGSEVTAECPDCGKRGGFYANTSSGAYVCFKCDFRGKNVVGLVAKIEGLSWSEARSYVFRNSVQLRRRSDIFTLLDKVRALRPEAVKEEAPPTPPVAFELPKVFRPCWDEKEKKFFWPEWLDGKRKIKKRTAKAWGLGFCRVGHYAGRLIIPIRCPGGMSFTARDMTDEQTPKYLNPTGADHRRLLIGWHCTPLTGDLVLCEGPFDALRLWQNDIPALACGGKELHDDQMTMLRKLPPETNVTIMLDPEEETAPYKVADQLSSYFKSIYLAKLPEGTDPGDATREVAQKAVDFAKLWKGSRQDRLAAALREAKRESWVGKAKR